jgi:hypothetical protein
MLYIFLSYYEFPIHDIETVYHPGPFHVSRPSDAQVSDAQVSGSLVSDPNCLDP